MGRGGGEKTPVHRHLDLSCCMADIRASFPAGIEEHLHNSEYQRFKDIELAGKGVSAVLFLLADNPRGELSLVLTKRSALVSQPGDLCSPGGRISPVRDRLLSRLLLFPGMPLKSWQAWQNIRRQDRVTAESAAMLVTAALRESWEEIGLYPFRVRLLGSLEPRQLTVFDKTIFPICAWTGDTGRLKPNREVESIHWIPLTRLLDPANYAAYSIRSVPAEPGARGVVKETICYRHRECEKGEREEILWGAALGVTLSFLKTVYNFSPPPRETLPLVEDVFSENYFGGI